MITYPQAFSIKKRVIGQPTEPISLLMPLMKRLQTCSYARGNSDHVEANSNHVEAHSDLA